MRTQFTWFESFTRAAQRVRNKTHRCMFYDIVAEYALYEKQPDMDSLPDSVAIAFELIKPNLDASSRKAASGQAGGKRKQTESKPEANGKQTESKPKQSASEKEKEKEKEGEKEEEKEKEVENECYPPIPPLPDAGPELQEAFSDWLQYKAERREKYKPTGLKSLKTEVMNNAARYGEHAVADVIRLSMASGWRGIIFDKLAERQRTGRGNGFDTNNPFREMLEEELGK